MAFRAHLKVCFSDIDYAGIVYYPRFLHYLHISLEEFFSSELGIDYPTILKEYRIGFPTVHLETDFLLPLHYGDEIDVKVNVAMIGRTSITWAYTVYLQGELDTVVVRAHNVTVSVNLDTYEKVETPDWLRKRLEINLKGDS